LQNHGAFYIGFQVKLDEMMVKATPIDKVEPTKEQKWSCIYIQVVKVQL